MCVPNGFHYICTFVKTAAISFFHLISVLLVPDTANMLQIQNMLKEYQHVVPFVLNLNLKKCQVYF